MKFTDQLNRIVTLDDYPRKIVSLVPSQTEFLSDAGLDDRIAGITKFCIHPDHLFRSKPCIGGTKKVDFEKIRQIGPDLIIGNKEENDERQIRQLMDHYPVWMSDIRNLGQAYDMMEKIGLMCDKAEAAEAIINGIKKEFDRLTGIQQAPKKKACYLIWNEPYMTVNSDTFIHDMMLRAGFENIFAHEKARYPEISVSDMIHKGAEVVILSSEPFPFKEKHRQALADQLTGTSVMLADGELFSWYGSRLKYTPSYLHVLVSAC